MIWILLVGTGLAAMMRYEKTSGISAVPPNDWPAQCSIAPARDKFTLVMLAHPDCPCTRASLAELERLTARLHGRLQSFIIFNKPESTFSEVQASERWKHVSRIPDATPIHDAHGILTLQFDGRVSGQTLLYDVQGTLKFSGGITGSRGHEGSNPGVTEIIRLVRGERSDSGSTPVFGCALYDPEAAVLEGDSSWRKD